MTLKIAGVIVAEGEEKELAFYSALLMDVLIKLFEARKELEAKKELDLSHMFENMTLEQLIRMEQDRKEDEEC